MICCLGDVGPKKNVELTIKVDFDLFEFMCRRSCDSLSGEHFRTLWLTGFHSYKEKSG